MANLSIAGAEGALIYLPVIAAGAIGATAAALGGFLTYKGLNWLAQKLFGTKEEAIEFAKLHLAAAKAGKPNFEFQGKSYTFKIKNKENASDLMMRVYELETQLKKDVAEGYDPVESDYQQWEGILVKDGYRGDPSGAYALKLVVGHQLMSDPAEVASTIRNILTYVKQNRQVLGKAVSDRTTVKDAIIDIKREYPQYYQAAQQPQEVAEGFNGEYDDEAGMAQSNLLTTARAVMGLLKTIKDRDNLPEWGQEKIAKAEMMLVSVWDYLQSQKAMGNDPQQDMAEGERTMSRAAKGYEKYGKKGMQALAKAGRDDASDEKLNTIRNKHNKYDEGEDPYFESLRARVEELAKK